MSSISVRALTSIDEFPHSAALLADTHIDRNPFVCGMWLREYERKLLKPNEAALYLVVFSEDVAQLIIPLIVETLAGFRIDKIRAMSNFYTNVYSVIASSEIEQDADQMGLCVAAAVDHIAREYRKVPIIELSPLRGNDSVYTLITECLRQHGYKTRRYFVTANWYEPFESAPNYEEYLKQRPGQLRSTLKRKQRALERDTEFHIAITKNAHDVEVAVKDFQVVYEESWKAEESYPSFIASMVTELAIHGKAMLGVLYVDADPAAAQIWLKIGDNWGVFKLAYRPQYSQYSVGSILTARMIKECLSMAETRCIDFLSGDDKYKGDWVSQRSAHWGLEAINTATVWGRAVALKRRWKRSTDADVAEIMSTER